MVCECGHNKIEHIYGRDYGSHGYECEHKFTKEERKTGTGSRCQCPYYRKKEKTELYFLKRKPKTKTQLAELIKELVREGLFTEKWKTENITVKEVEKTRATKVLLPNFDGLKQEYKQ